MAEELHDWANQPTFESFGEVAEQLRLLSLRDTDRWNSCIEKEIDADVLHDKRVPPEFCQSSCACCRIDTISKPREAVCCKDNPLIKPEYLSDACLTETARFSNTCLNRETLILVARNVFATSDQKKALLSDQHILDNRELRYFAYRSFSLTFYGKLPSGQRHELPCCCVHKIRSTFCSDSYTGFKTQTKACSSTLAKCKRVPLTTLDSDNTSQTNSNMSVNSTQPRFNNWRHGRSRTRKRKIMIDPILEELPNE